MSRIREDLESRAAQRFLKATLPRDCLIVLAFHRVGESLPSWHFGTSPSRLARTAAAFARIARPVMLGDVVEHGITGRLLALTFDDGFADNAEIAAPLLARMGLPAAFFLPAGCVESGNAPWPDDAYARLLRLSNERLARLALRLSPGWPVRTPLEAAQAAVHALKGLDPPTRDRLIQALPEADGEAGAMMTWEQARGLASLGMEIGSHGLTHAVLTTVGDEQLEHELGESRRLIEERLGQSCDLLAYPDNRCDDRVTERARAAGYRAALCGGERINLPRSDLFAIARLAGDDGRLGAMSLRTRIRPLQTLSFSDEAVRYGGEREHEYAFATQSRFVEQTLAPIAPKRVLDAGCGGGALVPALRGAGATEIVGVDAESRMVGVARQRYPDDRWLRSDLARLPFPSRSFDAVVCLGVLEYVSDPAAVLRELGRVAKPGAPLVLSVPQRRSPNALASRLYELARGGFREGARPLAPVELERALAAASLELVQERTTNFFSFPLTAIAARTSWRIAAVLEPLGSIPVVRRLGAQLLVSARRPAVRPLFWLAPSLPTATTFLDRELAGLQAAGVVVHPLAPTLGSGAAVALARNPLAAIRLGIEWQRLKARRDRERGRFGYLVLVLRALTLAEHLRGTPGRLHATFADGVGTFAYGVSRLTGRPYSFTAHSPYSLWQGSRLLARQAEVADVVVCASPAIEARLAKLAPTANLRVVRVPGPRDVPPRGPIERGLVLCVGRLIPHKGFATAIQGIALAVEHGCDLRLEVLGDGPERENLERLAGQLGISSRVIFRGAVANDQVLERLAVALAMLAPCEVQPDGDRDGLPASIVDAAMCGTPVIATAVGGIPDLIVDRETGLLVPERDPAALAAALDLLANDAVLADSIGRAGQERAGRAHDPVREPLSLLALWKDVDHRSTPFPDAGSHRASRRAE